MMEAFLEFFQDGSFWGILIKVLITALLTGLVSLVCTAIGRAISKNKNSKLYKQAEIAVKAAEQKYPNEGTKMGPQKMAYVMDYLATQFPNIKNNQYLYNIAEAAVYELNNQRNQEIAQEEFKEKYGELPSEDSSDKSEVVEEENNEVVQTQSVATTTTTKHKNKISSF